MNEEEKAVQDAVNPEASQEETATEEAQASGEAEIKTDWEAEAKKYKAIADRKSKQLEKVTSSLKDEEATKPEPKKDPAYMTKDEWETERFYDKNPDYEPFRDIISALKAQGQGVEKDIVKGEMFKTIFDKAKKADELESSKSVLQSNPRLGQSLDKLSEARTASSEGKTTEARSKAVEAVLDAFEL